MTKQIIIERTLKAINMLSLEKAEEISNFADFLIKKYEEKTLTDNIQQLISNSETFDFLNEDEDLYSVKDIKEKL